MKPESTERVERIFQEACNTENMDAKFGRTLSKKENDIRKFILSQSPVLGRIPSLDEIRNAFTQFSSEVMDAILNKLDQLDAIHLDNDKQTIAAAYPFSGSETAHFVTLDRETFKTVNAMCAIDALGAGFMFNCDSLIASRCHHCSERIQIRIQDNEIRSLIPANVVVWCDMEFCDCAATSLCKNINFFSSEDHFAAWQKENPRRNGELLPIGEAFYLGRLFFENRLES
ncbi:MAG: alkylmercury lyase family protein [Candidatus Hodarchaeales archaeon]|jgi:hypothetical protein